MDLDKTQPEEDLSGQATLIPVDQYQSPVQSPLNSVVVTPIPDSWPIEMFCYPDFTGNLSVHIPSNPKTFAPQVEPPLPLPSPKPINRPLHHQDGPPVTGSALTMLEAFRISIPKPTPIHRGRDLILRSNLRHLPFQLPDWPSPKPTGGPSTKVFSAAVCTGYRHPRKSAMPPGSDAIEVDILCSTDDESAGSDDEKTSSSDLRRRGAGRGEPYVAAHPWQHRRDLGARVPPMVRHLPSRDSQLYPLTRPSRPVPIPDLQTTSNTRKTVGPRERVPSPVSSIRDRVTDSHRRASVKRTRSELTPVAPKRGGVVTLPTAAQWTSELGTFQYLFDSHKLDEGAANRLARLLSHINDRKRDVSDQVMKVVGSGLVAKLQFFQRCSAFGSDCQEMADDILNCWASMGRLR